jgi:hypothetical protein
MEAGILAALAFTFRSSNSDPNAHTRGFSPTPRRPVVRLAILCLPDTNAERHSKPRPGVELCSTVENRHERLHIKNTRPLCAPMPSLRFGEAAFTRYDHLRGSELKMGQSVEPCRDSRQFRLAIVANICAQSRPAPAQRPSARHRRKVVL